MKLKALAAVALAAPLMVACGSTKNTEVSKEPYKLNGAGASFPAMLYNNMLQVVDPKTQHNTDTLLDL
jgi:phosphate transport system substrate-binding protein